MSNQFHSLPEARDGFLSSELLLETLQFFDITLTQEQKDYLLLRLFEVSASLKRIEFRRIYEVFPLDEQKRAKLIYDSHQQATYSAASDTNADRLR